MENILKMLPGAGGMLRQVGDLSPAKDEMKKMEIIISSMTKKERRDDKLFKEESRVQRVARGSGTQPAEVKEFLKKFTQMKQMMTGMFQMMKGGGMNPMMGMPGSGGSMGQTPGFRTPAQKGKKSRNGKKRGPFGKFRR